ncbi:MAG: phosphoenolpyruvate--protein phosphotransferase [Planctomycetaceae bacterium]|nr:phosphoenolpyruvate--protein phosphotransferase [Planctomycetaceae bacterium]
MLVRRGIAVSPGIAEGPALVFGAEDFRIPQRFVSVDAIESQVKRFRTALQQTVDEIGENERLANEQVGKQYGSIFTAHLNLVQDPQLLEEIEELIRTKYYSAEFASSRVLRRYAKVFQNLGDNYMAQRAADIYDIEKCLLRNLLGESREELSNIAAPVIIVANSLSPSETANLNRKFVLGLAIETGGKTSHTAILAGALEIPAVVGIGNFLADVSGGENLIIDGDRGEIVIDPSEEAVHQYHDTIERRKGVVKRLRSLKEVPAQTKDGVRIQLLGNIEFPEEVSQCIDRGADGVGLYRTEFLYLNRRDEPSEEVHYEAYRRVVGAFPNSPVIIRTMDLGADKMPSALTFGAEPASNPVLSLRSLRLSLKNLPLFKTQLRAILRAATLGDVRIMFPLVSTMMELRQAKMILADVVEDLEEQGVEFRRDVPVGMMVEVPSAVMMAEEFAQEVDFFSIGTNDLIQYTLAADRDDPNVSELYRAGDPSILRMIQHVIDVGKRNEISVTVCGEMSTDPLFTPLLIGMGLRQLSVTPHMIPRLKELIGNFTVEEAEDIARHVKHLELVRTVENYLRGELAKFAPDMAILEVEQA